MKPRIIETKAAPDTAKELAAFNTITTTLEAIPPERRGQILKAAAILLQIYIPADL